MKVKDQPTKKRERSSGKLAKVSLFIMKNLLFLAIAYFFVITVFRIQPGYAWVYNNLRNVNMAAIKKHPDLSTEEKLAIKLGTSYRYLQYIKSQTSPDAVILYPSKEDFFPPGQETSFTGEPYNKLWALRFLYPRKLIIASEIKEGRQLEEITHIAIVNGRNKQFINDSSIDGIDNGLIPISHKKNR